MELQDLTNQATFSNAGAVNWLSSLKGFVDDGERAAFLMIADEVRDKCILDIGVGAGRTIPLLRSLSKKYAAIDYLPVMVKTASRNFPDVDIQVGDARDLSRFANESIDLVVFSFAGIDAVDHPGRCRVLAEVSRVLKPNGIFWFSTLNRDGQGPKDRPWREYPVRIRKANSLRARLSATREFFDGLRSYHRLKESTKLGDGWLIAPFSAHAYGLLVHYITLARECDELVEAGFQKNIVAFDASGNALNQHSDLSKVDVFNIIARKAFPH